MPTIEELFANLYIQAFFIFAVFVVVAQIIYYIFTNILKKLAGKTETRVDDLIISKITLPFALGILFYGAKLGLDHLNLAYENITIRVVDSAVIMIFAFTIKVFMDILIDSWIKPKLGRTESTFDDSVMPLIHRFSAALVILIGLIFVLNRWGIDVGPLLAGLGVVGIAVAFALQSTLGNVLSGIGLVLDKNFQVGDVIEIEPGKSGTVVDIGFRSTKIKTPDNEILVIPNGQLANMTFKNFMQPDVSLRVTFNASVAYGSDPDKVKKIIMEQLKKIKSVKILKEPEPFVLFSEMGDFALKFSLYFWVESPKDRFMVKDELNTLVYNALKRAKIQIPFPTQIIHLRK